MANLRLFLSELSTMFFFYRKVILLALLSLSLREQEREITSEGKI